MNYLTKLQDLYKEVITELTSIKDRPEGWLPHTVFVEDVGVDYAECGAPVYNQYKLLDFNADGECQLLNVITDEVEEMDLRDIEIVWLITVLNWYGELTCKNSPVED